MAEREHCQIGSLSTAETTSTGEQVPSAGYNLLRLAPIRTLVLWPGFPYVFQVGLLIAFVGLAWLGWNVRAPESAPDKLFAKTHLVTLLIWGLWWPTMVWFAVLFGRAWCMVCPLELVSNLAERLSRRLALPQANLPRWMAAGWVILALYALIQLLVAGAHLHRVPHYTAIFLIGLLAMTLVTGVLIRHRAFCRGFCPVGLLLGTYGRGGMLAVRAGGEEKCAACDERSCLQSCNRTKLDGRSCPSLLNPPKLDTNRDCLVCGQCIKACEPDNMQLVLRPPFSARDAREPLASWPITLFVMLVCGFVTYELCSEWPAAAKTFKFVPNWIAAQVGIGAGWAKGVWMLFVVPLVVWTLLGLIVRVLGGASSIAAAWRRLALPVVVIIAAGHMAKGLAKVNSWGGYLPGALADPSGAATAAAISGKTAAAPAAFLPMWAVAAVGIALIVAGFMLGMREARMANGRGANGPVTVSLGVVTIVSLGLVLGWMS